MTLPEFWETITARFAGDSTVEPGEADSKEAPHPCEVRGLGAGRQGPGRAVLRGHVSGDAVR